MYIFLNNLNHAYLFTKFYYICAWHVFSGLYIIYMVNYYIYTLHTCMHIDSYKSVPSMNQLSTVHGRPCIKLVTVLFYKLIMKCVPKIYKEKL